MRVNYASSQISSPPDQPPSPLGKRSRKRITTFLGIVAVVAVASTLIFVLLTVPNVGATITLEYSYTPGESMTYNATITQYSTGQNTSVTATIRMDVTGFDGENYTISETTISPIPFSTMTENVNKTGYCTFLSVGAMQSTYCRPIGSFFQKEEARVGETWQVPCYTGNAGYDFNGTLTYKFGAIQNITVPAGTYKVFKVDVSGSNLTLALMLSGSSFSENMTFNTQMYMEYGTCRLIESETQDSMSVALNNQSTPAIYNESLQMILIKQIK